MEVCLGGVVIYTFFNMREFLRKKKKVLYLICFFFFAVSIPFLGYYLSTDRSFDDRGYVASSEIKITFTSEPELIRRGEESSLNWSVEGGHSCVAFSGDLGQWTGQKALSGSEIVTPQYSTLYHLSCTKDDYALTRWAVVNVVDPSPKRGCDTTNDCFRRPPYEICFKKYCLRGDIRNDGGVGMGDFEEFKKDYISFQTNGWNDGLKRSDLNIDKRISMDDYSVFVNAYRLINNLN